MIDLTRELNGWLATDEARKLYSQIVRDAVRDELRVLLMDELIDVGEAAAMLRMTQSGLRKAVERGQVPCCRIGKRVRFRRMDLVAAGDNRGDYFSRIGTTRPERRLPSPKPPRKRAENERRTK